MTKYLLAGIAFALLLAYAMVLRGDVARERAARSDDLARWTVVVAESERKARAAEGKMQATVDLSREKLIADQDAIRKLRLDAGSLRRDAGSLRDQLRAAGASRGVADSLAACQGYTGELEAALAGGGALLREGRELVLDIAEAHDLRVAEVKAFDGGWPKP